MNMDEIKLNRPTANAILEKARKLQDVFTDIEWFEKYLYSLVSETDNEITQPTTDKILKKLKEKIVSFPPPICADMVDWLQIKEILNSFVSKDAKEAVDYYCDCKECNQRKTEITKQMIEKFLSTRLIKNPTHISVKTIYDWLN